MLQVKLTKPVITEKEKFAYEVLALQQEPKRGKVHFDYVEVCAAYVAKRIVTKLCNEFEGIRYSFPEGQKPRIILEIIPCAIDGNDEFSISWFHPRHADMYGEIDVVEEFGYTFSPGATFFYEEWVACVIAELRELMRVPEFEEEVLHYCVILD